MQFLNYFQRLWFNEKEAKIFLALYKLGSQPASTIAKYVNIERTSVYKILQKLAKQDVVSVSEKNGIKNFFISDISILKKYVNKKIDDFKSLDSEFESIKTELSQFDTNLSSSIPKITIYDGIDGVKNIYSDIYALIEEKSYISIKFFASNLFESRSWEKSNLKNYTDDFFEKLNKDKIFVDTFLWNGIMVMESMWKAVQIHELENLPASNSSINMFIVGQVVYIIIFKDIPSAIKIDSKELAYSMHFIFEKVKID